MKYLAIIFVAVIASFVVASTAQELPKVIEGFVKITRQACPTPS